MIYNSKPITMEEKGELVHIMTDNNIRIAMFEVLKEITAPRCVNNIDCLKLISDLLRHILALFVHEQQIDYELMSALLDSSQYLFFLQNNRKIYLTNFIVDHGIWSNVRMWKECIELNIRQKMAESAERLKLRLTIK